MGYSCPSNIKGNFFLKTTSKFPFGLNKSKSEWCCVNADEWEMTCNRLEKEGEKVK